MRVLAAEDEAASRILLQRVLESQGHEVVVATDGAEAWERYQAEPFHVVVTDWWMPGIDGVELARRIRGYRRPGYTWIILLTGRSDGADHSAAAIQEGVDDYLAKPLNPGQLQARFAVAQRVSLLHERVQQLEECLPICMHCHHVRDEGDRWQRIDQYLQIHTGYDLSHALCPDCYYERSLRPVLLEHCGGTPERPSSGPVDQGVLGRLLECQANGEAGLIGEVAEGLDGAARRLSGALAPVLTGGQAQPDYPQWATRLRQRALDVGAWELGRLLEGDAIAEPSRVERIETEVTAVLLVLSQRRAS